MTYPFYRELQDVAQNMSTGNYGLWFNKFVPISNFNECKASDEKGNKDKAVSYYHDKYKQVKKNEINLLIDQRHFDQAEFCNALSSKYETVVFKARLKTPLITGIGESHPHEVSMVFDHNLGIPYIPASGIKGIVRFVHTLGLIPDIPPDKIKTDEKTGQQSFNDEEIWTHIPDLFGTQEKRGSVFFLDSYPEKMPDLHVDIMNPHYGDYYSDDNNTKPPGDYLNPNPIKFLTVAIDTVFVFRALVDKKHPELTDMVKAAFKNALTEEGIGAKTAVGYGLFEDLKEEESESVEAALKNKKEKQAQAEKEAIEKAEAERKANMSEEELLIDEIDNLQNDTNLISHLINRCLAGTGSSKLFTTLKEKLEAFDQWTPKGSKKAKKKTKERNKKIESRISL